MGVPHRRRREGRGFPGKFPVQADGERAKAFAGRPEDGSRLLPRKFGERYRRGHLVSERGFMERHNRLRHHIADAGIEIDGEIQVLIEFERSRKEKYEVVAILRKLRRLYPNAEIHYHCKRYTRFVVESAIRDLGLQDWVRVYDAPKFGGLN